MSNAKKSESDLSELLYCPFCGKEPEIKSPGDSFYAVSCPDFECPANVTMLSDRDLASAVKRWNKRVK